MNRLRSKYFNTEQRTRANKITLCAEDLYKAIENNCSKSRERKIALQRLEEVVMWANKAIAFEGVEND